MAIQQSRRSYTQTIADFVVETNFRNLPGNVVHDTKRIILDTIGCGIGGFFLDKGKIVIDVVREMGGKPESTIFGIGDKVSCANAVFANADLANALDADENFMNQTHHAAVAAVAALAMGERAGATGKELITSVALGVDVNSRVSLSLVPFQIVGNPPNDVMWAPCAGMGYAALGAAAAAGKILNLDKEKMANALGLAGANTSVPSLVKLIMAGVSFMQKYAGFGFIAHTGVLAALLAEKGYSSDRTILDGDFGFWRFSGSAGVDWDLLVGEIGKKWWISEASIKFYPSCRATHIVLDLFYKIMEEQKLDPDEIDGVTARVQPLAMNMPPIASPSLTPSIGDLSLQFNIPYLISVAALGIKPGPEWYSPERLTDPRLKELMRKVKIEVDPEAIEVVPRELREAPIKRAKRTPCSITIFARGKKFDAHAEYARGDPWLAEFRMSDDQLKEKFRAFTCNILSTNKIQKAIDYIFELENVGNITKLHEVLAL